MSKENTTARATETIASVRVRTGGVHFNGARIITTLTTEKTATTIAGSNVIVCDSIRFHPAGISFDAAANEGGGSHIIPYVNVEVVTLAAQ